MLFTVVGMVTAADVEVAFKAFVTDAEPRLRKALVLVRGVEDGLDATAEALAWAWEHWSAVQDMRNPVGYLYRVGVSRTRPRRRPPVTLPVAAEARGFEPGLLPALEELSDRQRTAVVLIHGCQWTLQEVAEALGISKSAVATHQRRALEQLRDRLGVITS